jgi:hypothetical protein
MDNIPTCPLWWPLSLWQLHHPVKFPGGGVNPPGSGPINLPPEVNQILIGLQLHASSYHIDDKQAAGEIRKTALAGLQAAVQALARAG